ncbi:MAG TPA: iron-sulfur cluster assembly scaffold protein [Thermoanaerobaculia bacterium]|nr:iron-sulfur cluster assembly scaffold protein [Thermoanaerobaculia bacterium]
MNFETYQKINDEKTNFREMDDADVVSDYRNQGCGDGYRIYLKISEDRIIDASYTTTGCGFGLVALALATELAKGRTIDEAGAITTDEIEAGLDGFPPRRKNYPISALEALQKALEDFRAGRGTPELMKAEVRERALAKLREGETWVGDNIGGVNFDHENLDGVDARGANLARASFRAASLRNANLDGANLRAAFLNDADLTGANLTGADLRWCKLTGARLDGAVFTGALFDAGTRLDPDKTHLFAEMRQEGKEFFVRTN